MTNEEKFQIANARLNAEFERKRNEKVERARRLKNLYNHWYWNQWEVRQEDKKGNLISIYPNVYDAENETGIKRKGIIDCMRCKQRTCGGYIWKYQDPYEAMRWIDAKEEREDNKNEDK